MTAKLTAALFLIVSAFAGWSCQPVRAADDPEFFPSFGNGPVEVRVYANYFCPPCKTLESRIDPILLDLAERQRIRLKLIDVPSDRESLLFAHYFLYSLKAENNLEQALFVRALLFDAAFSGKVKTGEDLAKLFEEYRVPYRIFDPRFLYPRFQELLDEDNVRSTPTVVIIKDGKKHSHSGVDPITSALRDFFPAR